MKITNLLNLPAPIVRAVTNDPYNKGDCDYSTTGLIKPARIAALEKLHASEITEDASDRIWSLCGQIGHLILERAGGDDIAEKRYFADYKGYRISGQVDIITKPDGKHHLQDYKFTSVFAAKDGLKPEWEAQLNINRWICQQNGIEIEAASIVAIFRDWSKGKARRESDFPQKQVQILNAPLWTKEKVEQYLHERICAHVAAFTVLPECTDAERWAKASTWAIKKRGGARSIPRGVHTTLADAEAHLRSLDSGYEIETRKGTSVRCLDYCPCVQFCVFGKQQLEEAAK